MSLWVRLIGGSHDGQVDKVDDDQVMLVKQRAVTLMQARMCRGSIAASQTESCRYTRRIVRAPEAEIVFFADEALSDTEALQHVLGP